MIRRWKSARGRSPRACAALSAATRASTIPTPTARDLRLLVRERLVAGDSDEEVINFVVDRYGEYVLLNPVASGSNLVLWLAGPVMLLLGGLLAAVYIRGRSGAKPEGEADLSAAEEARLREIMKD